MKDAKHIIYIVLSVVLLGVIQAAFFGKLRLFGVQPALILCFLVIISLKCEPMEALIIGVSSGLYYDIVYGRYVGLYGFIYMYIAILAAVLFKESLRGAAWWPCAVIPPLVMLSGLSESVIIRLLTVYSTRAGRLYENGFWRHFTVRILPVFAYNLIIIAVLWFPVQFILKLMGPKPVIKYNLRGEK